MANSNDIQALMSTKISVDSAQASDNVSRLAEGFKSLTASWKAEQAIAKANGDTIKAAEARYKGLSETLDVQKLKLQQLQARREALKSEMQSSATVTTEQTSEMKVLDKQLSSTARSVASLSNQQRRAKSSYEYAQSGLRELRNEYYTNNRAIDANVKKLEAQGHTAEAQRAKLAGLRESLVNLGKQESATQKLADSAAESEGKQSNAYKRRKTDLDNISAAIAKTKSEAAGLEKSLNPPRTSGWDTVRAKILGVDNAEQRAATAGQKIKGVFSGSFFGTLTANTLPMVASGLKSIYTNGMQAAQAGAALQGRWKNIGVSGQSVKQLSNQVTDLKTNTNLTAQSVNSLQTRFYGMTHSVSQTRTLTQGVASLSDQLKLSGTQANAFAGGLSRIESSGKVTSASLGRLERQAPGLTAAMAKASGMSQKSFQQLVASGKMTSTQFNQILTNASKNYDKNSKQFGDSSTGALHKFQQQWVTTQAALAKPLLKVSATGLNELNKSLSNPQVQKGLSSLATGVAHLAVGLTKVIGLMARYSTVVKIAAVATLGLVTYFKMARAVTTFALGVSKLIAGMRGLSSAEKIAALDQKALNIAMKANTIGLIIAAIAGLVIAFRELYKHSKTFRNFINGLWKNIKGFAKNIGKFIGSVGKTISKGWNAITKGTGKFLNGMHKSYQNYQKQRAKQIQQSNRNSQRAWSNLSKFMVRTGRNMAKQANRDSRNIWQQMTRWSNQGSRKINQQFDWLSRQTQRSTQQMFRRHRQIFQAGYRVLEDRTRIWHDVMTLHWDRLGRDTQRESQDMSRFHQRIFRDMYNRLNNLTDGRLGDMVKSWQDKMGDISNTVANARQSIHIHFVDLVRGIIKPFNDMLEDLHKGINWVLDKLGASQLGGTWEVPMPGYANGTPGAHPGGFAKVNDGLTAHYRELYRLPDGEVGMFPAVRNMIVPLPKGTSVLDGERSYQLMRMMGMMPHYANGIGALSDMFSGLINGAGDTMEKMMDDAEKIIAHPIEFMEGVFKKFVRVATPVKFAQDLVVDVPKYIAKAMADWVKKQFAELANPGGAGVARWRPYIARAFKALGLEPAAWKIAKLLRQIQTESGGNPTVRQQVWDVNMASGNPAQGLLQFIPSTFNHWALPGHRKILNGYDQILAAINALEHGGEGGWGNVGNGHGWANGGLVSTHGLYEVAEGNKPEMIIPTDITKRGRAYQLLAEVMTRFQADDPHLRSSYASSSEVKTLTNKLDQVINLLGTIAGLSSDQVQAIKDQGTFDTKSFYKRQARDAAMRQFS